MSLDESQFLRLVHKSHVLKTKHLDHAVEIINKNNFIVLFSCL